MTQRAGLDKVSASAKVTAILFPIPASPWRGRAGCRSTAQGCWKQSRQLWASLTLPGPGQGCWPRFACTHRWNREAARGERINLEELLAPASSPYAWQDGAGWREWLFIQQVYTEQLSLSGKHSICDATQKYLALENCWAHTQLLLHWMDTSVCRGGAGQLPGTGQLQREDLFLLRLSPSCYCWAMFCSHLLR